MCYYRHTGERRPIRISGEQDITSHVHFFGAFSLGDKNGLELCGSQTGTFHDGAGIDEYLKKLQEKDR